MAEIASEPFAPVNNTVSTIAPEVVGVEVERKLEEQKIGLGSLYG
jgi:hypothetical protein